MKTGAHTIKVIPVILCGGAGSRLWPMSRDDKPKQFHALVDNQSLLANTIGRLPAGTIGNVSFERHLILGNEALAPLFAAEALAGAPEAQRTLLEPSIRDTAAAIAAFTAWLDATDPDAYAIVLPSDARITDTEAFRETVIKAAQMAARTDAIMTLGIEPTRPETQYGYIERGEPDGDGFAVKQFREKPDRATAEAWLASGGFFWNAGIFLFRIRRMADEFRRQQPDIWAKASDAVRLGVDDGALLRLDPAAFGAATKLSIDYAIMEHAGNIGVMPAQFDWDDLGSWAQLHDHAQKDDDGNSVNGDVILVEASGNHVRAIDGVVALAGVDDLVVVAEDGKVLVTRRDRTHLVKEVTGLWKEAFGSTLSHDRSKKAIRHWLFDTCLPFWAQNGVDGCHGGVHEALSLDGTAAAHATKRMRVLPRQIYCFAHAIHAGWQAPEGFLSGLLDTLLATGRHPDGGFIHLWNPEQGVRDDKRDTYDHCFVLLACAWLHRIGEPRALPLAQETLAFMDGCFGDPVHGGFFEDDRKTKPRRANPHMHFLEAMLALYDATGDEQYLARADATVDLFERHFFDGETGTLTEFFADDWSPLPGRIEPGHHYEWAWLLCRYLDRRERPSVEAKARQLFASAVTFGHHNATGACIDSMDADGRNPSDRARCWPQTEALKAAIAFERRRFAPAAKLRAQMIDVLFDHYLDRPIPGGWYDAIDAQGKVVAPDMPSSTFYHVFCALMEHLEAA